MSENIVNLINAIQAGDASAVESTFQAAMADKIAPKLDAMRQEVASGMFASESAGEVSADTPTE